MCIECRRGFSAERRRGSRPRRSPQRGLTLIELVVFIVVVSVGLAGILSVLNLTNRDAVNPMLLKQQLAIAESLLEEVESKPFTFCDPDDANVETAKAAFIGADGCATLLQGTTHDVGESRYNPAAPFDNVGDYAGFAMDDADGIRLPTSAATTVPGLKNYKAWVEINLAGTAMGLADNADALQINVRVEAPSVPALTLTGYRFRYAPNSP